MITFIRAKLKLSWLQRVIYNTNKTAIWACLHLYCKWSGDSSEKLLPSQLIRFVIFQPKYHIKPFVDPHVFVVAASKILDLSNVFSTFSKHPFLCISERFFSALCFEAKIYPDNHTFFSFHRWPKIERFYLEQSIWKRKIYPT